MKLWRTHRVNTDGAENTDGVLIDADEHSSSDTGDSLGVALMHDWPLHQISDRPRVVKSDRLDGHCCQWLHRKTVTVRPDTRSGWAGADHQPVKRICHRS